MAQIKEWESAYDFFFTYFSNNCDASKVLRSYGLLAGKFDPSKASYTFRNLKTKYPDDYQNAKKDYLESRGIQMPTVFEKIMRIAETAPRDADKLKALELILRFSGECSDSELINNANKLTLEIVPPPTPAEIMLGGD